MAHSNKFGVEKLNLIAWILELLGSEYRKKLLRQNTQKMITLITLF